MRNVRQRIFRKRDLGCIVMPVFIVMLFFLFLCRNCETTFIADNQLKNTAAIYPFLTDNLPLDESTGEEVARFVEQLDIGCHMNAQNETRNLADDYPDLAEDYPPTQFDTKLNCVVPLTCDDLIDTGIGLLNPVVGCVRDVFFESSLYMHFLLHEEVLQEIVVEVYHSGIVSMVER